MTTLQMLQKAIESNAEMNALGAWSLNIGDLERFLQGNGIGVKEASLMIEHLNGGKPGSSEPPPAFVEIMKQRVINSMFQGWGKK